MIARAEAATGPPTHGHGQRDEDATSSEHILCPIHVLTAAGHSTQRSGLVPRQLTLSIRVPTRVTANARGQQASTKDGREGQASNDTLSAHLVTVELRRRDNAQLMPLSLTAVTFDEHRHTVRTMPREHPLLQTFYTGTVFTSAAVIQHAQRVKAVGTAVLTVVPLGNGTTTGDQWSSWSVHGTLQWSTGSSAHRLTIHPTHANKVFETPAATSLSCLEHDRKTAAASTCVRLGRAPNHRARLDVRHVGANAQQDYKLQLDHAFEVAPGQLPLLKQLRKAWRNHDHKGVEALLHAQHQSTGAKMQTASTGGNDYVIEYVLVADASMWTRWVPPTRTSSHWSSLNLLQYLVALVHQMDVYIQALGLGYRVMLKTVVMWKVDEISTSVSGSALLAAFRSWGLSNNHGALAHDAMGLITAHSFGAAGQAYVNVFGKCFDDKMYSITQDYNVATSSSFNGQDTATVLTHELGHNLGAVHTGTDCPGSYIMDVSARSAAGWSQCTVDWLTTLLPHDDMSCFAPPPSDTQRLMCGVGWFETNATGTQNLFASWNSSRQALPLLANRSFSCAKCSPECKHCNGSAANCTCCPAGQVLWHDGALGRCVSQCPTGFLVDNSLRFPNASTWPLLACSVCKSSSATLVPSTSPAPSPTPVPTTAPTRTPTTHPTTVPTAVPTAEPTAEPTEAGFLQTLYVKAGATMTVEGVTYVSDTALVASTSSLYTTTAFIEGTVSSSLLQTERYWTGPGPTVAGYRIAVAAGTYDVMLIFSENYFTSAGRRVFDVRVQNQTVAAELDIFAAAGKNYAHTVEVHGVAVTAGSTMAIDFLKRVNNPMLNVIQVRPSTPTTTPIPTSAVTPSPTTAAPTAHPTAVPTTGVPTASPTTSPTSVPTSLPAVNPTTQPSHQPTGAPTSGPTASPTSWPTTAIPTASPTWSPTRTPTSSPTAQPSQQPTGAPTSPPTSGPTASPSTSPTSPPTNQPSLQPSVRPTAQPTNLPTDSPTVQPTSQPTAIPTPSLSAAPTLSPTATTQPTSAPTGQPTAIPTSQVDTRPEYHISAGQTLTIAGVEWVSDNSLPAGMLLGSSATFVSASTEISGTLHPQLFVMERYWTTPSAVVPAYELPVRSGRYRVEVFMAENYFSSLGRRRFSIFVENRTMASELDIFHKVGRFAVYSVSMDVDVLDGAVSIVLGKLVQNPIISAVRVVPVPVTTPPTASPTTTPTLAHTGAPTVGSTSLPTTAPTSLPTPSPSTRPTAMPTAQPSAVPTAPPSPHPTARPTAVPTQQPTSVPTSLPTSMPTNVAPSSSPTPASGDALLRVTCGGPAFQDTDGHVGWVSDSGFAVRTGEAFGTSSAIAGSSAERQSLYQTERFWRLTPSDGVVTLYELPVPAAGNYSVVLHLAEIFVGTRLPGNRVFSLWVEDQEIPFIDIAERVGFATAMAVSSTVRVSDGAVTIKVLANVQNPKLSGVELYVGVPPLSTFPSPKAQATEGQEDNGHVSQMVVIAVGIAMAGMLMVVMHCRRRKTTAVGGRAQQGSGGQEHMDVPQLPV